MPLSEKSRDQFDRICDSIAEGLSLRKTCDLEGMPTTAAVRKWLREDETGELVAQYARAREEQAEVHADEILEVSRDESLDVQRAKLIADNMRWVASKLKPKVYGDKVVNEHKGGVTVTVVDRFGDNSK